MRALFILMLLFPLAAFAECKDVNLYALPDSPLNQIPVYDQDGSGTCYAYTASQLLNYHYLKTKKSNKLLIHPAWAAVNYAVDVKKNSTSSGWVYDAIEALENNELHCNYESVRETLLKIGKEANMTEPMVLAFLEKYAIKLHEIKSREKPENLVVIDNTRVARQRIDPRDGVNFEYKEAVIEAFRATEREFNKSCNLPGLNSFLDDLTKNTFATPVRVLQFNLFQDCLSNKSKRMHLPKFSQWRMRDVEALTNTNISKKLDEELANGRALGISYCSTFFTTGKTYTQQVKKNGIETRGTTEGCGGHASLVVGSRREANRCEYLVKNTWGSYYWGAGAKCYCENVKTKKRWSNCSAKTHPLSSYRVLGCWFPKDKLTSNIFDVSGIK